MSILAAVFWLAVIGLATPLVALGILAFWPNSNFLGFKVIKVGGRSGMTVPFWYFLEVFSVPILLLVGNLQQTQGRGLLYWIIIFSLLYIIMRAGRVFYRRYVQTDASAQGRQSDGNR